MKKMLVALALLSSCLCAQQPSTPATTDAAFESSHVPKGAKLFIEPMDGFETYLSAAILKKKVSVVIVDDQAKADYVVSGTSHTQKAGWAKTIFVSPSPSATASITIKEVHTGNLAFAYSVDKLNAVRANQSTAEACAKHLKEAIENK